MKKNWLPRFQAPKDMKSRVFMSKKDKSKTRQALNKLAVEE